MLKIAVRSFKHVFIIFCLFSFVVAQAFGQSPSVTPIPTPPLTLNTNDKQFIQQKLAAVLPQPGPLTTTAQRYFVQVDRRALSDLSRLAEVDQYPEQLVEEALLEMYGTIKIQFRERLSGSYALEVSAGGSLVAIAGVTDAVPDIRLAQRRVPNDPLFSQQWGLRNNEGSVDIDAVAAWSLLPPDSIPPIVAVFDTGMQATHEDLAGSLWVNSDEVGGIAGVDDDGNGYIDDISGISVSDRSGIERSTDQHGHGSAVSGIIAARSNNSKGISGVCHQCKIMTIKLDVKGPYVTELIEALRYAADMRRRFINDGGGADVRVFNMSIGTGLPCRLGYHPVIDTLIEALEEANEAGIVVVGATDNAPIDFDQPQNEDIPTTCPTANVVAVANLRKDGSLHPSSAFGKLFVKVAAPGSAVTSVAIRGNELYSHDYYGTSFAAPHVAGVAALILQARPTLLADEVIDILVKTSEHSEELDGLVTAGGIINARRAVLRALGDLNGDGSLDDVDIDILRGWVLRAPAPLSMDINSDGSVNQLDLNTLVQDAIGTCFGDANLDCVVDTEDYNIVRSNLWSNLAGWADGNFNIDSGVDVSDYNLWSNNRFEPCRCAYTPPQTGDRTPRSPVP